MTSKCPPLFIKHQTVDVDSHTVVGVTVDNNLSWSKHVTALYKTVSKKVYQKVYQLVGTTSVNPTLIRSTTTTSLSVFKNYTLSEPAHQRNVLSMPIFNLLLIVDLLFGTQPPQTPSNL